MRGGVRASDRELEMQVRGFRSAAGITLLLIDDRLDTFTERMKGPGLNKSEQAAYAALVDLKSEIETHCDRYWRGHAVDWRPPGRVFKGKVSRQPRGGERWPTPQNGAPDAATKANSPRRS